VTDVKLMAKITWIWLLF